MEIHSNALKAAKKIKLVIFDVDGVLTDGGIYIGAKGELYKPFYCRDGLGISLAHKYGLQTAIITGRKSEQVAFRAKELGICHVFQGNSDKRSAYDELKERTGLKDEQIAYIGDDLIDLPVMLQVGLPMAVADAEESVRAQSLVVSGKNGGHGAVRELLEFIFKVQGKWEDIMADFLLPDSFSENKNWKQ